MSFLVLVPLLPLLTAFIVMTGDRAEQDQNARAGLLPIVASFLGALLTLALVTRTRRIGVSQRPLPGGLLLLTFDTPPPAGRYTLEGFSGPSAPAPSGPSSLPHRSSVCRPVSSASEGASAPAPSRCSPPRATTSSPTPIS